MQQASVTMTLEEWQYLLNVLGELPSKSGVWAYMMKIKQDVETQLNSNLPVEDSTKEEI